MEIFQTLSAQDFFANYWQKKPVVFRQAIENFQSPLGPDELAGLACEEDIESRLVLETGGEKPWQALSGPFEESKLRKLAESGWSLSVQGADRILPEVSALLKHFRFLPTWLLDDIMVSYAPDGGSVGAHIDNYDVFIIQGQGKRRWLLGGAPQYNEEYHEDLDIRLLKEFTPEHEWELEHGDILYIPTRFAHHGIALGECLNYSVGFRAPTDGELIRSLANWAVENDLPEKFFSYSASCEQGSASEITAYSLDQIKTHMKAYIDSEHFTQWFGQHISEPKTFFAPPEQEEQLLEATLENLMSEGAVLIPSEGLKRCWIAGPSPTLYIEGERISLPEGISADLLQQIGDCDLLSHQEVSSFSPEVNLWPTLCELCNRGYFSLKRD